MDIDWTPLVMPIGAFLGTALTVVGGFAIALADRRTALMRMQTKIILADKAVKSIEQTMKGVDGPIKAAAAQALLAELYADAKIPYTPGTVTSGLAEASVYDTPHMSKDTTTTVSQTKTTNEPTSTTVTQTETRSEPMAGSESMVPHAPDSNT